jgi:hypothetical protein
MRKGITLLTVLLLPITIYLIFAVSTIHYVRVPHYGPCNIRIIQIKGKDKVDTLYHTIGAYAYESSRGLIKSDTFKTHMYLASIIKKDSEKNGYNLAALKAYYKVNKGELDTLHFIFYYVHGANNKLTPNFGDSLEFKKGSSITFYPDSNDLNYLLQDNYFIADPRFPKGAWKSTADLVLIDAKGTIRGYYDARYAPEITRMIEDIKHIKFHDEAEGMEKKYTPVKKGSE